MNLILWLLCLPVWLWRGRRRLRRQPPPPQRRRYWDWDGEAYRALLRAAREADSDTDAHA